MNRSQRRLEKLKKKQASEKKALIKKRRRERLEPETRWDTIKHWLIISAFILGPLWFTYYSYNRDFEKIDLTSVDIKLSESIEINHIKRRNSNRSYHEIIIWDDDYPKPFQVPWYKEKIKHKRELENIEVEEIITIDIDIRDTSNLGLETFWNNWTTIYGISHQGIILFKTPPNNIPPEGNWTLLFFSLFGMSFIPYEFIEEPWIQPRIGLVISAVISLILPFLVSHFIRS